ncbi:MAG: ECF transporter S component [Halanaerobiales bacterium]
MRGDIKYQIRNLSFNNLTPRLISFLAMFTAFVAVGTYLHIPGPSSSYFNLGEVAIYIVALIFGSKAGGIAGGVGSALVDISLGFYSFWAPFTLVIKGLEGYFVGKIAKEGDLKSNILAIIVGGNIMVIGYAITKGFLISWPAVIPEIGIDYAQMIIGGLVALPLSRQLNNLLK